MTNQIICNRCKHKYDINDDEIKIHFGYNKLNERLKCCVKCRNQCKLQHKQYYQNNMDKIKEHGREYGKFYYQNNKEQIKQYKEEYRQKKNTEKKQMINDNTIDKLIVVKDIMPSFTDLKKVKQVRLRYNVNGMTFEKKRGYAKIGYEKAKEELNIWFNEQIKKYT